MKTQLQSYFANYKQGYHDKHASRYLCKRDPQLWAEILSATNFLPTDAKAKQRCWHVLHAVYTIPRCPITNEYTKWFENRYLTYSSLSAKQSDPKIQAKVCKPWKDDECRKAKVRTTFTKNREAGKHIIVESPFKNTEVQEKCKATMLDRYGYENNFYSEKNQETYRKWQDNPRRKYEAVTKAHQTKVARGIYRTYSQITEQEKYYKEVAFWTEWNWYYFQIVVNPDGLNRSLKEYHVDHTFSQAVGFRLGIEPKIIGHWTNLSMMWCTENNGKNKRCDKTVIQLLDDYYRATTNTELI